MRIILDKNVVDFFPESVDETGSMEVLWRKLIDCSGSSQSLSPIGEYIPSKKNQLSFVIEGGLGGKTVWSEQVASKDDTYICTICNKYMNVKAGDSVPLCCGKLMECVD